MATDLNETAVVEALAAVGGPPAVLVCEPGPVELTARRICQEGLSLPGPVGDMDEYPELRRTPAAVEGVEIRVDPYETGWRLEKANG